MIKLLMVLVTNAIFLQWVTGDSFPGCTPNKYFPHPTDCNMYYYCQSQEIQELLFCPYNQYFDNELQRCAMKTPGKCSVPSRFEGDDGSRPEISSEPSLEDQKEIEEKSESDFQGYVGQPALVGIDDQTKYLSNPVVEEDNSEEPSEETSGSNKFFYALKNFEEAIATGGSANEESNSTAGSSETVRQQRSEDETAIVGFSPEVMKSSDEAETTKGPEVTSTSIPEGKTSSDSKCDAMKSFPAYPIVGVLLGKKDEEDKVAEEGKVRSVLGEDNNDDESKNNDDSTVNTEEPALVTLTNSSVTTNESSIEHNGFPDLDKISITEVEPKNATSEEESVFKIPELSFYRPSEFPFKSTQSDDFQKSVTVMSPADLADSYEGNKKATEIEEAKSALIYEGHTEEIQKEPPATDDYSKLIVGKELKLKK